jgi:hypothetical protein
MEGSLSGKGRNKKYFKQKVLIPQLVLGGDIRMNGMEIVVSLTVVGKFQGHKIKRKM